jgi:OOP family OmpA-OmpF porin
MSSIRNIGLIVLALIITSGCSRGPDPRNIRISRFDSPDYHKPVLIEHAFILADASLSMADNKKFKEQLDYLIEFVQAMPVGSYEAGFDGFAGYVASRWFDIPMQPFDGHSLANLVAREFHCYGDDTTLPKAFAMLRDQPGVVHGIGAVVVFSDGVANYASSIRECRNLLKQYPDQLRVHTVQVGNDPLGENVMRNLAMTGHGTFRNVETLSSPEGMRHFIGQVFLGEIDTDGDGVFDPYDQCPDTPLGARVDDRGCWVISDVNFKTDSATIKPENGRNIDQVAHVLINNPNVRVRVDGHTDSRASERHNMDLSLHRAKSVVRALIQRGIPMTRMEAMGFGENHPIRSNESAKNMALNRRVEFTVIP